MTQTTSVTGEREMKNKRHFCILKRCGLAQHGTRSACLEIWKATHRNHNENCRADMPVSQWKGKQLPTCIWQSLEWGITVSRRQENMCHPETRCHNLGMSNTGRAQGKDSCNSTRIDPRPATYSNGVASWKDYKRSASSLTFAEIWGKAVPAFRKCTGWECRSRHSCLLYPGREGTHLGYSTFYHE